jgi:hypothetical protein
MQQCCAHGLPPQQSVFAVQPPDDEVVLEVDALVVLEVDAPVLLDALPPPVAAVPVLPPVPSTSWKLWFSPRRMVHPIIPARPATAASPTL